MRATILQFRLSVYRILTDFSSRLRETWTRSAVLAIPVLALLVIAAIPFRTEARITRIQITRIESPTFEGYSFGDVGQYEKLAGKIYGEVDPDDPRNAVITDIGLAPRNANGMVEYVADVYILRPVDPSKGNHRILYEAPNRGSSFFLGFLNNTGQAILNDPTLAAHAGDGFVMRMGYTIVLSAWEAGVPPGGGRLTFSAPVAVNPDGSSVTGLSLEELVVDAGGITAAPITYKAANLDETQATLSVRTHYSDPPVDIPSSDWEYVNESTIRLLPAGTPFVRGTLYEFAYPAKDPVVAGLGYAATRDVIAFFHHSEKDDDGNANPLAGDVEHIYTFCFSQPCRFFRDFVKLGFNQDEDERQVFDGMLNWVGGPGGLFLNYRFAQPGRTHRQHIGRWYPEREFPFANQTLFDPVTGKTDGRLKKCQVSGTCPKIFEANSANEYWVKTGSLLHTDTLGNDLSDPENVRFYFFSSLAHLSGASPPPGPGACQQDRNPVVSNPGMRALLVALDQWVSGISDPPDSKIPRRDNGTLVNSLPQAGMGFPVIPGVAYNGLMTTGDLFDFGPQFEDGILTILPPIYLGSPYPAYVPMTDADGNDLAGVRLPEIDVPLATYTGWGLRIGALAGNDLCDMHGQKIPFYQTMAERLAAGDPRLSIEERYPTHGAYVKAVAASVNRLRKQRLLLDEDGERYVKSAAESKIGN